jgi:predicted enzyme related to lactoylglutathione lyase
VDQPRVSFLVNIDVDDLERATAFYTQALELAVGRRFEGFVELLGGNAPIYLLGRAAGTPAASSGGARDYARHWTPVHLDFVVSDLPAAVARAERAGAVIERPIERHAWGTLAVLSDPFGHGFCLLSFNARGYDALLGEAVAARSRASMSSGARLVQRPEGEETLPREVS